MVTPLADARRRTTALTFYKMKNSTALLLLLTPLVCACGIMSDTIEVEVTQQDFLGKGKVEVLKFLGPPSKRTGLTGNGEIFYYETQEPDSSFFLTLNNEVVKDIVYLNHKGKEPVYEFESIKKIYSNGLDWIEAEPDLLSFFKADVLVRVDNGRLILEKDGGIYVHDEPNRWKNSGRIKVIYP